MPLDKPAEAGPKPFTSLLSRVAKMERDAVERQRREGDHQGLPGECTEPECEGPIKPAKPAKSAKATADLESAEAQASLRRAPKWDNQPDFFVPTLYDVGTRDSRGIMDVAVFRLSKKDRRPNSVIRYELPDGHVVVSSGMYGMASVWDYDIVLMAISHLTEAMNRYREGKGEKPGQVFRPHVGDVLKFCRRDNGGKQKDAIVGALERLSTTHVHLERTKKLRGRTITINEGEGLIGPYKAITNTDTGKVEFVEIKVADWMYREVTEGRNPDVLTVHPDYFLIDPGIGRFIYRLARRAAGKTCATWSFQLIYERSGSTGKFKEFSRILRGIIEADDLPEYALKEEQGQIGPMLTMQHRAMLDAPPPEPEAVNLPQQDEDDLELAMDEEVS